MSTEWGALVGWFPVDGVTLAYLDARNRELRRCGTTRIPEEKLSEWRSNPPAPDPDAVYAGRIVLDLAQVTPHVSGPDTVQVMESVAEIANREGGDPEGVSRLLREFAAGRSGGRSATSCAERKSPMA